MEFSEVIWIYISQYRKNVSVEKKHITLLCKLLQNCLDPHICTLT